MQYVTPLLWLLGLAFVTLAWLGVILSLSMLARGLIGRAGQVDEGALPITGRRPMGVWGHGLITGVTTRVPASRARGQIVGRCDQRRSGAIRLSRSPFGASRLIDSRSASVVARSISSGRAPGISLRWT